MATLDTTRAAKEVRGIFNNEAAIKSANSAEFSLIRSLLFGYQNGTQPPPGTPSGLTAPTASAILLTAVTTNGMTGNSVDIGAVATTMNAADPFVMEYANGMPLEDVAWGQLSLDGLSQQTRLINLPFSIALLPPYVNQVQSSNAASHILRSMEQVVIGETIPGAFGDTNSKILTVISSDAYVFGLAGLMRLHWQLPGYQPDFCAPGGALVFELRQSRRTREYIVRAYYTSQSFDQLRNLAPLTLDAPPETMQLTIPGGRKSGANLDVSFRTFQRLLRKAIDPTSVQDPTKEVPPGVLTGVPLS